MSCNRENVAWQTKDGKWSLGFYSFFDTAPNDPEHGWDHEWDVDYDYNSFWWVSVGHPSAEDAMRKYRSWHGNPGCGEKIPFKRESDIRNLNEMAWTFLNPEAAKDKKRKERDARARKHRKEALELYVADPKGYMWKKYRVSILKTRKDFEFFTTVTGTPVLTGDWFMIEKEKFLNVKTGRFNSKVALIEEIKPVQRSYASFLNRGW